MKCRKCHTTMIKDVDSRTATCPYCGRTVHYRTKSERRNYYSTSTENDGEANGGCCSGCATAMGSAVLIVIVLLFLLLDFIFGDGIWSFLENIFDFLFNCFLGIFEFIFDAVIGFFDAIFDFIFR